MNCSLLHVASHNNLKEIGEILTSNGADINAQDIIYQIIIIVFSFKII